MNTTHPTPYPEVNALLQELLESVQAILGSHFVGLYLDGSLTSGDFDQDSDIDFVVATDDESSGALFTALQAMHERIATIDSWYAIHWRLPPFYAILPPKPALQYFNARPVCFWRGFSVYYSLPQLLQTQILAPDS